MNTAFDALVNAILNPTVDFLRDVLGLVTGSLNA